MVTIEDNPTYRKVIKLLAESDLPPTLTHPEVAFIVTSIFDELNLAKDIVPVKGEIWEVEHENYTNNSNIGFKAGERVVVASIHNGMIQFRRANYNGMLTAMVVPQFVACFRKVKDGLR